MPGRNKAGVRPSGRVRPLSAAWRLPVDRLVVLAPRLAEAVADWHDRAGPHGRLCPEVIDLDEEGRVLLRPAGPVRPRYLAPEQTGRLRCAVDERCDLYALGVLLYQLATGNLPVAAREPPAPDSWTDPRLASRPERPGRLVAELPEPFEEILLLLLAAVPHQRYQSARGLAADLRHCRDRWLATGRIEPFLLAGSDVTPHLRTYGRIYGRDRVRTRLVGALDRVRRTGRPELVVMVSEEGLGKTAAVDAFADEIALSGGRVVGGRFRAGSVPPYDGLVTVVDDLAVRLAAAPTDGRPPLDARLRDTLGWCAAALGDLSPTVAAHVAGTAAPAEGACPAAAEHRVRLAVRRLVEASAITGQPLVITLDDLHRADPASIALVRELLTSPHTRHLLVVATCRSAVPARHPVGALLSELRQRLPVTSLRLRPLADTALTDWVADTLRVSLADAAKLAHEVAARTGSVPLLAVQFLSRLADGGRLWFDRTGPRWQWQLDAADTALTVGDLGPVVHERLQRMTPSGRRLLSAAAVLGTDVDQDVAALVSSLPVEQAAATLEQAVRAGLLIGVAAPTCAGRRYRWASERVRQVLLGGLGHDDRQALELACGRAERSMTDRVGHAFFAMVDHFNAAGEPGSTDPLRVDLAELNLSAGRRAWRLGALPAARHYLQAAVTLIRPIDDADRHRLIFDAYAWNARVESAAGDAAEVRRLLAVAGRHAVDGIDRAGLLRIDALTARRRGDRRASFESVLAALELLGVTVPQGPAADVVEPVVRRVLRRLTDRRLLALAEGAPASERRVRLAADIVADLLVPLGAADDQAVLIAAIGVDLSLDHGLTVATAPALARLAIWTAQRSHDDRTAERCLRAALRLVSDDSAGPGPAAGTLPAVAFVLGAWLDPADGALDRLDEARLAAIEQGAVEDAEALEILYCAHRFLSGAPLDSIATQLAGSCRCSEPDHPDHVDFPVEAVGHCLRDAIERLRAGTDAAIGGTPPSVGAEQGYPAMLCATVRLAAACVLGDAARVGPLARELAGIAPGPVGFAGAEAWFYRALATAMSPPGASGDPAAADLETMQPTLDHWAARAPAMFSHKALLIAAERARIAGDDTSAARHFDVAIEAARTHDCAHIEAIAAERAALHAERCGETRHAATYRRRARDCYRRWNAYAKLELVDGNGDPDAPAEPASGVDPLDLLVLGHAFEALSADLDADKIVDSVAELFLRHTGADRACLLMAHDDGLSVAAVATAAGGTIRLSPAADLGAPLHTQVPMTVVDRVRSTGGTLAADRQTLRDLPRDPYLLRRRPRALLCAPLTRSGRLFAVVYLEYHRQPPPDSQGYLHTLPLLCLHAATVLNQATVTRELHEATQVLDAAFGQLPVGLILLGPDLTVYRASPHACRLARLPIRRGTPIAEVLDVLRPVDTRQASFALELALAVASADQDEPVRQTLTLVQPAGPRISLHACASPLRRPDRTLFGVALLLSEVNATNGPR